MHQLIRNVPFLRKSSCSMKYEQTKVLTELKKDDSEKSEREVDCCNSRHREVIFEAYFTNLCGI